MQNDFQRHTGVRVTQRSMEFLQEYAIKLQEKNLLMLEILSKLLIVIPVWEGLAML